MIFCLPGAYRANVSSECSSPGRCTLIYPSIAPPGAPTRCPKRSSVVHMYPLSPRCGRPMTAVRWPVRFTVRASHWVTGRRAGELRHWRRCAAALRAPRSQQKWGSRAAGRSPPSRCRDVIRSHSTVTSRGDRHRLPTCPTHQLSRERRRRHSVAGWTIGQGGSCRWQVRVGTVERGRWRPVSGSAHRACRAAVAIRWIKIHRGD